MQGPKPPQMVPQPTNLFFYLSPCTRLLIFPNNRLIEIILVIYCANYGHSTRQFPSTR